MFWHRVQEQSHILEVVGAVEIRQFRLLGVHFFKQLLHAVGVVERLAGLVHRLGGVVLFSCWLKAQWVSLLKSLSFEIRVT